MAEKNSFFSKEDISYIKYEAKQWPSHLYFAANFLTYRLMDLGITQVDARVVSRRGVGKISGEKIIYGLSFVVEGDIDGGKRGIKIADIKKAAQRMFDEEKGDGGKSFLSPNRPGGEVVRRLEINIGESSIKVSAVKKDDKLSFSVTYKYQVVMRANSSRFLEKEDAVTSGSFTI